jgi:phosphonate transport system substrate-binding protein
VPDSIPAQLRCKPLYKAAIGLAAMLWAAVVSLQPAHGQATYALSIVPQQAVTELHRHWAPIVRAIRERAGVELELQLRPAIAEFEKGLYAGEPDFAYVNPYHFVVARQRHAYVPLVRGSAEPLVGILVVRSDSAFTSVAQLAGKEIAFPSPNAFGASLYMRALLAEKVGIDFRPRYVQSHANTYRSVLLDEVAAGGGIVETLRKEPAALRQHLKVLYTTPPVAPHPLVAHPRVPATVRAAVVKALLALENDAAGKVLLRDAGLEQVIAADHEKDYASLARLKLEKYWVEPTRP